MPNARVMVSHTNEALSRPENKSSSPSLVKMKPHPFPAAKVYLLCGILQRLFHRFTEQSFYLFHTLVGRNLAIFFSCRQNSPFAYGTIAL